MENQTVGCPIDFKLNCKNLDIQCIRCACLNQEEERFYYSPISSTESDLQLSKHPYIVQLKLDRSRQKREVSKSKRAEPAPKGYSLALDPEGERKRASQKGRQANRAGHKVERRVIKNMGGKLSYLSGAVAGAGDGELTLCLTSATKLKVEHKLRMTKRNILGPTSSEWEIAQKRGVEVFLVTHENSTTVTMSATVFEELLSLIKYLQE